MNPSQQELFKSRPASKPVSGRGNRATSRKAHSEMKESGELAPRERQVMAILRVSTASLTRAEIANRTGMTHGAACGRVHALIAAGLAVETERRLCRITGGDAHGVRAA